MMLSCAIGLFWSTEFSIWEGLKCVYHFRAATIILNLWLLYKNLQNRLFKSHYHILQYNFLRRFWHIQNNLQTSNYKKRPYFQKHKIHFNSSNIYNQKDINRTASTVSHLFFSNNFKNCYLQIKHGLIHSISLYACYKRVWESD